MLLKNGEIVTLTENEIKKLRSDLGGRFPVVIKYPKNLIRPNKHNKIPDVPNSIQIPLRAIRRTNKGSEEWRWCDSVSQDSKGKEIYTPNVVDFSGNKTFSDTDIEQLYFLYYISPYSSNGGNSNGSPHNYFHFEDKAREAKAQVDAERINSEIDYLVLTKLKQDEVISICRALFLPGVKDKTEYELRIELKDYLKKNRDGYNKFKELYNDNSSVDMRSTIQKCIELKIISFNEKSKKWLLLNEEYKTIKELVEVRTFGKQTEVIVDYFKQNPDLLNEIKLEISSRSQE